MKLAREIPILLWGTGGEGMTVHEMAHALGASPDSIRRVLTHVQRTGLIRPANGAGDSETLYVAGFARVTPEILGRCDGVYRAHRALDGV